MVGAVDAQPDGIYVKGQGLEVRASARIAEVFERTWNSTLQWIAQNQLDFVAVLFLLGWLIYQRRLAKTDVAKMKLQYDAKRADSRQPTLSLPEPPKKDGGGS